MHVVVKVDEWQLVGHRRGLGGVSDRLRALAARSSAPGLAGDRRAVLEGIVLGDDAELTDGLKTSFRRSGLYHLLAVSGQNVVLLAAGALALAWLLGLPRWSGHVGAVGAIGVYVLAVGPQPSVIRAAVSGVAVSAAWLHVARTRSLARAPARGRPPAGLEPVHPVRSRVPALVRRGGGDLRGRRPGDATPRGLSRPTRISAMATAVSAVCSVATAPILWLRFQQVPLLGVVANVLVEPVIGVLLGLGLVTALVGLVLPQFALALASANGWVAAYVVTCARAVAAVPFAQATGPAAAAVTLALLLARHMLGFGGCGKAADRMK